MQLGCGCETLSVRVRVNWPSSGNAWLSEFLNVSFPHEKLRNTASLGRPGIRTLSFKGRKDAGKIHKTK